MKCNYCNGKNLYLRRTSPMEVWGCRDCDKKVIKLKKEGLTDSQIKKVFSTFGSNK